MGILLNGSSEHGPTYTWRIKPSDTPIGIDLGLLPEICAGDITADLARALWLIPNDVVVRLAHTTKAGVLQGVQGRVNDRKIDGYVHVGRVWVDASRVKALVIVSDERFDQTCPLCEATPDEPCLRHRVAHLMPPRPRERQQADTRSPRISPSIPRIHDPAVRTQVPVPAIAAAQEASS